VLERHRADITPVRLNLHLVLTRQARDLAQDVAAATRDIEDSHRAYTLQPETAYFPDNPAGGQGDAIDTSQRPERLNVPVTLQPRLVHDFRM
jgi:hypothetical protein